MQHGGFVGIVSIRGIVDEETSAFACQNEPRRQEPSLYGRASVQEARRHESRAETRFECRCLSVETNFPSNWCFTACPEIDSFVITAALLYPACRSLHLEAANDPILHCPRLAVLQHRSRHTGHRPAYSRGVVDPLSVGPQIAPWPFERTRKAHLAVAPHRQRNGASNEFVISRRSAGHRRASRHCLSPASCCR